MQQHQGQIQAEYLSKLQSIQHDFIVAQGSSSTPQQNKNRSEPQEVNETKNTQQNGSKKQIQKKEEKLTEKSTKNDMKTIQAVQKKTTAQKKAADKKTAKEELEKEPDLSNEYLPIPPINPDDQEIPELKAIWTKIAKLEKIVQNNNQQQIQNHTLKVFEQVEEYFSSFLR